MRCIYFLFSLHQDPFLFYHFLSLLPVSSNDTLSLHFKAFDINILLLRHHQSILNRVLWRQFQAAGAIAVPERNLVGFLQSVIMNITISFGLFTVVTL